MSARQLMWPQAFTGPFIEKIPMKPLVDLQLARIDEARGRTAQARTGYATFLTRYDLPPSGHRHLVGEAQAALTRLSRAPDPARDR
jgi:hypothetical protein